MRSTVAWIRGISSLLYELHGRPQLLSNTHTLLSHLHIYTMPPVCLLYSLRLISRFCVGCFCARQVHVNALWMSGMLTHTLHARMQFLLDFRFLICGYYHPACLMGSSLATGLCLLASTTLVRRWPSRLVNSREFTCASLQSTVAKHTSSRSFVS